MISDRKFKLAVGAFITFTALLVIGKIDMAAYVTLSMFVLGGYLGANVVQKATAKKATDA